jgi:hypothetical protein
MIQSRGKRDAGMTSLLIFPAIMVTKNGRFGVTRTIFLMNLKDDRYCWR